MDIKKLNVVFNDQDVELTPEENLLASVLKLAVQDKDVDFIGSDNFDAYCAILGLESHQAKIKAYTRVLADTINQRDRNFTYTNGFDKVCNELDLPTTQLRKEINNGRH